MLGTRRGLEALCRDPGEPLSRPQFLPGNDLRRRWRIPADDLPAVIRYFGERKKIFNVHFRNIKGLRDDFVAECFPDDGDVDLGAAVRAYQRQPAMTGC